MGEMKFCQADGDARLCFPRIDDPSSRYRESEEQAHLICTGVNIKLSYYLYMYIYRLGLGLGILHIVEWLAAIT